MTRYTFDFDNAADGVDFLDILDGLPPVDRRIARLILKGYLRREIGVYVGLSKSTIYRRVKKMQELFTESGKNQFLSCRT